MAEPFRFFTELKVRFNETDAQGHVNFAWYLNYFDVALTEYLRAIGYSYSDMLAEGLDMLYIDAHTTYQSPAYFEELLEVHCRLGKIGSTSMRFDFQVIAQADGRPIATGEITVVMAQRDTYQKVRVPDHLRAAVETFEDESALALNGEEARKR
jgi:acyl-CoA thioester hydrolase